MSCQSQMTQRRMSTMTDNLRTRIAAAIYGVSLSDADPPWERVPDRYRSGALAQADAVIAALDRDYIVVEPGTPLAQKIVEWQWETAND